MKRALAPPLLVLFVLLAVLLRSLPEQRAASNLESELRSELGSALWIRSPKAAAELRRVELCLATDRIARGDAFLDHPSGLGAGSADWARASSPLFPWMLAAIVERVLETQGPSSPDRASLGGVAEAELEDLAARVPLILTGLTAVALGLVALGLGASPLGLAGVLALWGLFPLEGRLGQLGSEGLVAFLVPAFAFAIHRARRAASTDAALYAMVAGFLGSLACLLHGTGLPIVLVGVLVLLSPALDHDPTRARDGLRTGLLYLAACAMPIALATQGPLASVEGTPTLVGGLLPCLLLSLVPFLIAGILEGSKLTPPLRGILALGAPVLMAFFVPDLTSWVPEGWWPALVPTSTSMGAVQAPAWLEDSPGRLACRSGLFGLGLFVVLRSPRPWNAIANTDRASTPGLQGAFGYGLLALGAAVSGVAALAPFLILVGLAALPGHSKTEGAWRPRHRDPLLGTLVHAFAAAVFLLPSLGLLSLQGATDGRGTSGAEGEPTAEPKDPFFHEAELLRALRTLRAETPSPGPWNHPTQAGSYGLLAPASHGPLVAYHARRPVVGALPGLEDHPGQAVARALVLGPGRARTEGDREANFAWSQARGFVVSTLFSGASSELLERAELGGDPAEPWSNAPGIEAGFEVRIYPDASPSSHGWQEELQSDRPDLDQGPSLVPR